jgi:hypothetical protein
VQNIPVPISMCSLPVDPDRAYFPVPWFVAWIDGKPDYRVIEAGKIVQAVKGDLCWLCGKKIGPVKAFVLGPMCTLNRTISEPPSHTECAEFALRVCPFLTQPKMRRNAKGLPEDRIEAAGMGLDRNPGAYALWQTAGYRVFRPHVGADGVLFSVGDLIALSWWCEGRAATREEVLTSIDSGLPSLMEMALVQPGAMQELSRRYEAAVALLPPPALSTGGALS